MMKRLWTILTAISVMGLAAVVTSATQQQTTYATAQQFEHGRMIYRADTGTIYVLLEDGTAFTYAARVYGDWPANTLTAPDGFYTPINGFGRIWANRTALRDALGWATLPEIGWQMPVAVDRSGAVYLQQLDATIYRVLNNAWALVESIPDDSEPAVRAQVSPAQVDPGESYTVSWQAGGTNIQYVTLRVYDMLGSRTAIEFEVRQPLSGSRTFQAPVDVRGNLRVEVVGTGPVNQTNRVHLQEDKAMTVQTVDVRGKDNRLIVRAAYQPFENGSMLWRADSGTVRVFMRLTDGRQLSVAFQEADYSTWADFAGDVPEGFVRPRNAFGRIWARNIAIHSAGAAILRDLTGYPTAEEREVSLELVQDNNRRVYRFGGQTLILDDFFAIEAKSWRRG